MKNIHIKLSVFFVLVVLLNGCTGLPAIPSAEDMKGIKRIGVVSLLGEEIEGEYVGTTIFGNEHFLSPALGWNLNTKTIDEASLSLKKDGFDVVKIDYDYDAMWKKYIKSREDAIKRVKKANDEGATASLKKSYVDVLMPDLKKIGKQYAVDGLVVIMPSYLGSNCLDGDACIGYGNYGYGVYDRFHNMFEAYISAKIYIVPLKSLKAVAQSQADIHVLLPIKHWYGGYSYYSSGEKKIIQQGLYKSAEQAIPQAIAGMSLSPNGVRK